MKNERRYISSVALLAIVIFLANNIHDSEAGNMNVEQIRNFMRPPSNNCIKETGVSQDMFDRTRQNLEFPADPLLQAYFWCFFKIMKVLTKDGAVDINSITREINMMASEDLAVGLLDVITPCYDKLTTDDVRLEAWELSKCFCETNIELYFLP